MPPIDLLIMGQGLAGTTLAWQALWRGAQVMVVERGHGPSASRVAAGLISPVSGKRLALAWRASELGPAALMFYREVEREIDRPLLTVAPAVRLFVDEDQRAEFAARRRGPLARWIVDRPLQLDAEVFDAGHGGFESRGARLDVAAYVHASREAFAHRGAFVEAEIDPAADFDEQAAGVRVERLGVTAKRVVLCRGWSERSEALRPRFQPAKGETLTLRVPGLRETRVVQRGVWLAPAGDGLWRVGSTFDRDQLDERPTAAGRQAILEKLERFLRLPYEVVDHQAGVRPIVSGRRPVAGFRRPTDRVGVFNGLGAKGALWAPYFADSLARCILNGDAVDPDVDAARRGRNG